ncbi:DUF4165 domain-containing protein, partial [Enterobacter hormaechei subsp. xiangfangensis]|uniref:DUF4165 domain-containing protein n=1 Tax=Enterobacter hormaechei TaxID=158836 RepID=UPI0022389819
MKIKLALLIAFAGFSAGASAEIAEFSFKDTLNVKKTVSPASVWINPVTSFDVAVISGLDRYITLSLLKSDGSLIWSTKSSLVLMNPLMILVKIIKLRWIHILSYDQMV